MLSKGAEFPPWAHEISDTQDFLFSGWALQVTQSLQLLPRCHSCPVTEWQAVYRSLDQSSISHLSSGLKYLTVTACLRGRHRTLNISRLMKMLISNPFSSFKIHVNKGYYTQKQAFLLIYWPEYQRKNLTFFHSRAKYSTRKMPREEEEEEWGRRRTRRSKGISLGTEHASRSIITTPFPFALSRKQNNKALCSGA